jgi:hypothetical protein
VKGMFLVLVRWARMTTLRSSLGPLASSVKGFQTPEVDDDDDGDSDGAEETNTGVNMVTVCPG